MSNLIVIPTQSEVEGFLGALRESGSEFREGTCGRIPVSISQTSGMTVACGGMGKAELGVRTQHLIDSGAWSLVACFGAAGSLASNVVIGDVVIGTETVEHDFRKANRQLIPRFPCDAAALGEIRTATHGLEHTFAVHFGPIASGDEDILDPLRREAVRERTGAIAVAWEGAGAARACSFSQTPFIEIRGVADNADPGGPRDFAANLSSVMRNLAAVAEVL